MKKPLILVTNDDGITAPGMRALIEVMKELGEVVVVAPDKPQSAMGHAITINNTLFINKISLDVVDMTVAGYTFISEKAITSPNKFPEVREDKCSALLLANIRLISIVPEIIKPILLQGSYSNAMISFLLKLIN